MQHQHIRAQLICQPPCVRQLKFRLEGGTHVIGFHPRGVPLRRVQQVRRIHAAGEGNGNLPILGKKLLQRHIVSSSAAEIVFLIIHENVNSDK